MHPDDVPTWSAYRSGYAAGRSARDRASLNQVSQFT